MERTTVSSLLRSTQGYCQQICKKDTLDHGIAFYSEQFRSLPEANQLREVILDDPAGLPAAFERTERWFGERGLTCHRWSPALSMDEAVLGSYLTRQGFERRTIAALRLAEWPELSHDPSIRVLPARALREALRQTFLGGPRPAASAEREIRAESFAERLNDPQLDMFVAMVGASPAGRCGLYQVGDIARVIELSLVPGFEPAGVAEALLGHVLAMARRLAIGTVLAQIESRDELRRGWLAGAGFVEDGCVVEFERPGPFAGVAPA